MDRVIPVVNFTSTVKLHFVESSKTFKTSLAKSLLLIFCVLVTSKKENVVNFFGGEIIFIVVCENIITCTCVLMVISH